MEPTHIIPGKSFSMQIKKNIRIHNEMISNNEPQTKATFQDSMRATLFTGQVLSLIPVGGVLSRNSNDVKFKITSWKCLYSLLSILGQTLITIMYVHQLVYTEADVAKIIPTIFNVTICCIMLMNFQIARSWPDLVQYISHTEELNPNFDNKLAIKCNVTCAVMITLTLIDKILFILAIVTRASVCYNRQPNSYEGFIKHLFSYFFNIVPYSHGLGIIVQFLHLQGDFIRNYIDLFLICISYNLTSRLEQINKKLKAVRGKYRPETFWRSAREEYYRITQLVRKVDNVISGIVFISFANDLLCICLQLFNTIHDEIKGTGFFERCSGTTNTQFDEFKTSAYFTFSLLYLVGRSIAVSLTASQINTAALVPATVLYEVPSQAYCVEVERFLDQVYGDKVALSGLQFFTVTRGLLLTIAGTIVTYELVMFQFDTPLIQDNTTALFSTNITTNEIP